MRDASHKILFWIANIICQVFISLKFFIIVQGLASLSFFLMLVFNKIYTEKKKRLTFSQLINKCASFCFDLTPFKSCLKQKKKNEQHFLHPNTHSLSQESHLLFCKRVDIKYTFSSTCFINRFHWQYMIPEMTFFFIIHLE